MSFPGTSQQDPKNAGAKPPFAKQEQSTPGDESQMSPPPDFGEDSYVGHGRLKDKVALITGGDSGIGRAVALAFAREGAHIAISYLPEEANDAAEVERFVKDSGRECLLLPGDIQQETQCKNLVDETVERFKRIDVLVNNAAFQGKAADDFTELTADRVERSFKTNVIAMFNLTRFAIPHMKPGSAIINTSSIQSYKPSESILDYASTKGAIVAFTKGLAQELLPKHGIRVNSVAPGPVWTPLIVQSFSPEVSTKFGGQSPAGRPAQPKELAPPYVFLACDESRFVNGEILGCDRRRFAGVKNEYGFYNAPLLELMRVKENRAKPNYSDSKVSGTGSNETKGIVNLSWPVPTGLSWVCDTARQACFRSGTQHLVSRPPLPSMPIPMQVAAVLSFALGR